ncbi:uncharacterized protein isoform X1 [Rhodnius prolixus]|uniref:uncharacterized protein isoform X1 n=1 Tax=Rhodnius prolixus TaxID=13249 RepID=UPI003D18855E
MKAKSNYRQMQTMAKKLGLPGNLKHNLLEALVQARQSGNEAVVDQIIKENKEERDRKRRERAEVRQSAQRSLDIYQNGMDSSGLRIPTPQQPPVKRPQGRPRKNRLSEPPTSQLHPANRQLVHTVQVNTNQRELSQLEEETLLQSPSLLDLLKLYDSAYNNNNSMLDCRPASYQMQGKARSGNALYSQPMNMPTSRSSCRYSVAPAQQPKPVHYGKTRFYNETGFPADLHSNHYSKLKATPLATAHYQDSLQPKFGANLPSYPPPTSHHLNSEYQLNCASAMNPQVKNVQGPHDFTYVPGYGCVQQQPQSCFPCTSASSSSTYNTLNHHNNQPSVFYENYKTLNNETINESNFLYGDDNQPQIMSTTPCSESTVSANELTEDSSYNNSSSFLPADNSLIGNTSCNGYILPSTSLSTFSTAPPSIDGKPTSEPCTSQLYFYPTPTFHFEQNPSGDQDGCTYIIPETLNIDYKKEIFEEHPVELSVDNLDTSDYCNAIVEQPTSVSATSNVPTNEVLPDLQQLELYGCKKESIVQPKKELKEIFYPFVIPQGADSDKTIIDEILEEGSDETVAVSNEDLDNLIIWLTPKSEASRTAVSASPTKLITTEALTLNADSNGSLEMQVIPRDLINSNGTMDPFAEELDECSMEEALFNVDFPCFNEVPLRTYQRKTRKVATTPLAGKRESLPRACKRYQY